MLNAQGDPQLLAGRVAQAVRAGRSYDYFQDLAHRVATLEPAQVRRQIDTILAKPRSVTLVQGPQDGVDNVITHLKITDAKHLPNMVQDEKD
jgi:predicted Zn-dependent peptidase